MWFNYPYNFDNIYNALLTLLITSSFDEWSSILGIAINSNLPETVPMFFNFLK